MRRARHGQSVGSGREESSLGGACACRRRTPPKPVVARASIPGGQAWLRRGRHCGLMPSRSRERRMPSFAALLAGCLQQTKTVPIPAVVSACAICTLALLAAQFTLASYVRQLLFRQTRIARFASFHRLTHKLTIASVVLRRFRSGACCVWPVPLKGRGKHA